MTQRVLYVQAQVILGNFDADGDLISEQPVQEVKRLYKPMGLSLQQYVDEIARECQAQEEKAQ
jgi:hypothetical protein